MFLKIYNNPMINNSISVFLPAYNEEENIKQAILSVQEYLKKKFDDYEIIIVDDGSSDKTAEIVKNLSKKNKRIKLVSHNTNLGYGAALRSGFKNVKKDLVFYTDSDNQFNIKEMDILFPLIKKFDIVSGFRIKRRDPLMRIFIAYTYNLIIRMLFNLKVKDIDASFKLYKRHIFDKIQLKANTGLIDAEVLIKAQKKGFTVGQVGVTHYPRAKGRTIYEVGNRNKVFAFVRPQVVIAIFKEIKTLWKDLR